MYILYKVSEPTLTINTKFTLFDFDSNLSIVVNYAKFRSLIDNIFNVDVNNNKLHMTDCDISEFFAITSNSDNKYFMVLDKAYCVAQDKVIGYEIINQDGNIQFMMSDSFNAMNTLNSAVRGGKAYLINATCYTNNNAVVMESKGEYPFVLKDEKGVKVNANDLLTILKKQFDFLNIPYSTNIDYNVYSMRDSCSLGRCEVTRNRITREISKYRIFLSKVCFTMKPKYLMDTLAHELIHTCKGCDNHDVLFIKYASMLNKAYGYNIKVNADRNDEKDSYIINAMTDSAKYQVQCQKCGTITSRNRVSRVIEHPEYFTCKCGGNLKRIK